MALGGLDSALSGLRIAQQQMNVISVNVANASTPGYTRKILPQTAVSAGGVTIGVQGGTVIRNVNLDLERDFWTQVSSTKFFEVQQSFLTRIQKFHGPPDQELSVAAKIAALRDSFAALSSMPDDLFLIQTTVNQAVGVADKINEFADLLTRMRNDTQDELQASVDSVNDLLIVISELNKRIKTNTNIGKTVAALEDERDNAIRDLSAEMEVTFFKRGDGVLVVQTNQGIQLADERPETLFFSPTPVGPQSVYFGPGDPNNSISGIFIGGNPANNPTAFDITQKSPNGRIGALLDMRDNILLEHTAQLDELAFRMAQRFDMQGIRLFTDGTGNIPLDSNANMVGTVDLAALSGGGPLSTLGPSPDPNDSFSIILNPNGATPRTITIDLSDAEATFGLPGEMALVNEINAQIAALPAPFDTVLASLNANNQLVINSPFDIQIDASGGGQMGTAGLNFLGMTPGITNAAPDLSTTPPTPVPYVGFASEIQVNEAVLNDNTLIRSSTISGVVVQNGSNEFLRRVVEFVFGDVGYQEAQGNVDLRVSLIPDTLQNVFGLFSQAQLVSTVDLRTLGAGGTLSAAPGSPYSLPGGAAFSIDFFDGSGAQVIDLEAAEAFSVLPNGGDKLADYLNNVIIPGLIPPPVGPQVTASLNPFGQLVINSTGDITIGLSTMTTTGLSFLGLTEGITQAQPPSFEIQVGQDNPVAITIVAGDTEIDLLNKINTNVPGVRATINPTTGFLDIRPGLDPSPSAGATNFGGDIKIISGSVLSTAPGNPTIIEQLFGAGLSSPVVDVAHSAFRESNLGPSAAINTGIIGATNLITFAQKMISRQTQTAIFTEARFKDEETFRDILQRQLLDESGVNIEEELSNMIIVQTAFSASARMVQALDELLQELINIVR